MASSSASFFAFISDSDGAPTWITATPPGKLGQPLPQLLLVVVAGGLLDLTTDLLDPAVDRLLVAGAADDGGVVLVDHDALGRAQAARG